MSTNLGWYNNLLAETELELYGETYTLSGMDETEIKYYDRQFDALVGTTDSVLRAILGERKDTVFQGIRAIKSKLENRKFRGLNPRDTEIGFSLIRPGHVKGGDRGFATLNALMDGTSMGWRMWYASAVVWDDWLASAANTGFLLSEDHGLIITHLSSYNSPTPYTAAVRFTFGRTQLVPIDVQDMMLGDNETNVAHFPIPTIVCLPETSLLARTVSHDSLRLATERIDYLRLGGFTVGLGRFLSVENYSAVRFW